MKNWDFERWLLAVMVVLILALVGFIVVQRTQTSELSGKLRQTEDTLAGIGQLAVEFYSLEEELLADRRADKDTLTYFQEMVRSTRLPPDSFAFQPSSKRENPSDGYADQEIHLKPTKGNVFSRNNIAALLLNIETFTNRMKATKITINKKDTKTTADEWVPDIWLVDRAALN